MKDATVNMFLLARNSFVYKIQPKFFHRIFSNWFCFQMKVNASFGFAENKQILQKNYLKLRFLLRVFQRLIIPFTFTPMLFEFAKSTVGFNLYISFCCHFVVSTKH